MEGQTSTLEHVPAVVSLPAGGRRRLIALILVVLALGNAALMVWVWAKDGGLTAAHGGGARATTSRAFISSLGTALRKAGV